jgi:hypothetical protein
MIAEPVSGEDDQGTGKLLGERGTVLGDGGGRIVILVGREHEDAFPASDIRGDQRIALPKEARNLCARQRPFDMQRRLQNMLNIPAECRDEHIGSGSQIW